MPKAKEEAKEGFAGIPVRGSSSSFKAPAEHSSWVRKQSRLTEAGRSELTEDEVEGRGEGGRSPRIFMRAYAVSRWRILRPQDGYSKRQAPPVLGGAWAGAFKFLSSCRVPVKGTKAKSPCSAWTRSRAWRHRLASGPKPKAFRAGDSVSRRLKERLDRSV